MESKVTAEELMLGNYISYNNNPILVESSTIRNIDLMGDSNVYQPIPLTPEILEKAGGIVFKGNGYVEVVKDGAFYVRFNNNGYLSEVVINCIGVYDQRVLSEYTLHRFQNLVFALTNNPLKIEIK